LLVKETCRKNEGRQSGHPGPNEPLELVENHHSAGLRIFTAANSPKIIEIDSWRNGMEHAFYHGNG
jgi:hypothetical protein